MTNSQHPDGRFSSGVPDRGWPAVAGAVLDDIDSRAGSATSLVRTVLGAYVRDLGGWIAIADLTMLLSALGVPAQSTRTAVTRLKSKRVLHSECRDGNNGYGLTAAAEAMFVRGDSRIFGFRQMAPGDAWRLISFGIPESERAARHQLRRRLASIGCGTVSAGLWICPEYLAVEAAAIVTALGLDAHITTFLATEFDVPGTLRDAVSQWWDLDSLAERHRTFLDHRGHAIDDDSTDGRDAFARFVPLLDEWRIIPYVDPGLPDEMLPSDWPGPDSVQLFTDARRRYLEPSRQWVRTLVISR
ncbi:PaaX family transcriptional regulator [Nocardia australiensis]|uniref:PaaX family transcriptional regulator n=1 Tax=Nocardia australiensis TaxID=2887191 RepID=UPI001D14348B|nr:PaaX family transcriptional regulator C-terminal domain-containing protein [Nocardia australiensis]